MTGSRGHRDGRDLREFLQDISRKRRASGRWTRCWIESRFTRRQGSRVAGRTGREGDRTPFPTDARPGVESGGTGVVAGEGDRRKGIRGDAERPEGPSCRNLRGREGASKEDPAILSLARPPLRSVLTDAAKTFRRVSTSSPVARSAFRWPSSCRSWSVCWNPFPFP